MIIIINCSNNSAFRYEVKLHQIGIDITGVISHRKETPKTIQNINYIFWFLIERRNCKRGTKNGNIREKRTELTYTEREPEE